MDWTRIIPEKVAGEPEYKVLKCGCEVSLVIKKIAGKFALQSSWIRCEMHQEESNGITKES